MTKKDTYYQYGNITAQNKECLIAHLRSRGVNVDEKLIQKIKLPKQ